MTSAGKRKPRNSRASVISSAFGGGGGASAAPTRSQATAQCNGSDGTAEPHQLVRADPVGFQSSPDRVAHHGACRCRSDTVTPTVVAAEQAAKTQDQRRELPRPQKKELDTTGAPPV